MEKIDYTYQRAVFSASTKGKFLAILEFAIYGIIFGLLVVMFAFFMVLIKKGYYPSNQNYWFIVIPLVLAGIGGRIGFMLSFGPLAFKFFHPKKKQILVYLRERKEEMEEELKAIRKQREELDEKGRSVSKEYFRLVKELANESVS